MRERANVPLDPELKNWAKNYTEKNKINISNLINQYFLKLKQIEKMNLNNT